MSVLNPRNRLVNFRLSEMEFEDLKAACSRQGARSISDFARSSVLQCLDNSSGNPNQPNGRITDLDLKVSELETRVEQLLRLIGASGVSSLAAAPDSSLAGDSAKSQHN